MSSIVSGRNISLFDQIIEIFEYMKALCSHPHFYISDEVNMFVRKLKHLEYNVNLNIRSKLQFIKKQLQFAFINIKHRRYSTDLLSVCILWGNVSSSLYKQTRDERLLTIPSARYIKKLTSALSVETGLTENTY